VLIVRESFGREEVDGIGEDEAGGEGGRSGSTVRGCDMDRRLKERRVSICKDAVKLLSALE